MTDESKPTANPLVSLFAQPTTPAEATENPLQGSMDDLISAFEGSKIDQIIDPTTRAEEAEMIAASHDLVAFASLDTSQVAAIKTHADRITNAADRFILRDAESFRSEADALDQAMQDDQRFDAFGLSSVRNYVMSLMTTMSRNEELASILLDRDIRNCVLFARKTYELANHEDQVLARAKEDKAAERARRPASPKTQRTKAVSKFVAGVDISKLF